MISPSRVAINLMSMGHKDSESSEMSGMSLVKRSLDISGLH